jgi:hypothetical protein
MELFVVGKRCFLVVIFLSIHFGAVVESKPAAALPTAQENITQHGNKTEGHGHGHKIKVAKFDFQNIATPFIVTVWVLLASLLKVGE